MKNSIRLKLEQASERFQEITALLAQPEVQGDQEEYRSLTREYAQIDPIVSAWNQYTTLESDIESASGMLADPEMAEMAQEEIEASTQQIAELEPRLQMLLLPPDPKDDRNIYLEVRAGTGGAEAALFAGDLLRAYLRYAEARSWQVEAPKGRPGSKGEAEAGISCANKRRASVHEVQVLGAARVAKPLDWRRGMCPI